jgi:hypothetical protein
MRYYLALLGLFLLSQVFSNKSSRLFSRNHCRKKINVNNCFTQSKMNKIIRDIMTKSEKIKNIIIQPEPDDEGDWESGEVPWEPKNITDFTNYTDYNEKKSNETRISVGGNSPLTPLPPVNAHDVAMLFV